MFKKVLICIFLAASVVKTSTASYFIVFTQETGSINLCHIDTASWSSWTSTPIETLATLHIKPDGHAFYQNERVEALCRRPMRSISHEHKLIYLVGNIALPFPHLFKWKKPHETHHGASGEETRVIWARSDEYLVRICRRQKQPGVKRAYEITLFPPDFDRAQTRH